MRKLVPLRRRLENFARRAERWGWAVAFSDHPRLVMARITAFGHTAPCARAPLRRDWLRVRRHWFLKAPPTGRRRRPPVYPDYMTLFTAFGVLAALRHRDLTAMGSGSRRALRSACRVLEYLRPSMGARRRARARGLQHAVCGRAFQTQDGHWASSRTRHTCSSALLHARQPDLPKDPGSQRGRSAQTSRRLELANGVVRLAVVTRRSTACRPTTPPLTHHELPTSHRPATARQHTCRPRKSRTLAQPVVVPSSATPRPRRSRRASSPHTEDPPACRPVAPESTGALRADGPNSP